MPTPIPVDQAGDCAGCDLCCVLAAETSTPCTLLYWLCSCPGGTLTLQFLAMGWSTWTDFDSASGSYYIFSSDYEGIGGRYRLKCQLDSGEVFYSNEVEIPSQPRMCYCSDETGDNTMRVWGEIEVCQFTRASFLDPRVYGTPESFAGYVNCNETLRLWSLTGAIPWNVDLGFATNISTRYSAAIVKQRVGAGGGGGFIPFEGAGAQVLWSALTRNSSCFFNCFDLGFDGSAISFPSNDNPVSGILTAWTATGGSGFSFHYSAGYSIIVRDIHVERVPV